MQKLLCGLQKLLYDSTRLCGQGLMSEVLSIYVFNRLTLIGLNYHNFSEVIERIYTALGRQLYAISFYLNPFKSQ